MSNTQTYLFGKYNRIYLKEEATCATVRKVMSLFARNVLNNAICQSYPNCCSLGQWLVDEHL